MSKTAELSALRKLSRSSRSLGLMPKHDATFSVQCWYMTLHFQCGAQKNRAGNIIFPYFDPYNFEVSFLLTLLSMSHLMRFILFTNLIQAVFFFDSYQTRPMRRIYRNYYKEFGSMYCEIEIRFDSCGSSHQKRSIKKMFLKTLQNYQGNTCDRGTQVFSSEFCENFKNTFFAAYLWWPLL